MLAFLWKQLKGEDFWQLFLVNLIATLMFSLRGHIRNKVFWDVK